ncbi:MAG: phosphoadenosine phosphosulfate reductase [Shimia sp.]
MTDLPDLSDLSREKWLMGLKSHVEAHGEWRPLSRNHLAASLGEGDTLYVTFEDATSVREDRDGGIPFGMAVADALGAAALCILCDKPAWFRDPALYDFFDMLSDDGAFDEFDRVVFHGWGMGGYAAAAFCVAAPGAQVVLIQPQATLDPRVAEWDTRFMRMRKASFTDRYGYAPDMVDAAESVFILYDPEDEMDAMHTALFTRPNVEKFRCRHFGADLAPALDALEVLKPTLGLAAEGKLTVQAFAELFRARREHAPYLRRLIQTLMDEDRGQLAHMLAKTVMSYKRMPVMRRALEELAKRGIGEDAA